MEQRRLGRTGLKVSRICLGTSNFGSQCDETQSHAILDRALDLGIRFIDTADIYPLADDMLATVGRSEEILAPWLRKHRDDVIVATKCHGATGVRPWDKGLSRKHILHAVEASLRRLGTDYVDLLQIHGWDPSTPIDETLETLDGLIRAGKARYLGCSGSVAYLLMRALGRSDHLGLQRFATVQVRYNLLARYAENELFACCEEESVSALPFNVLAGGLLTGKHRRGAPEEGTRFTEGSFGPDLYKKRYWHDAELTAVEEIRNMSDAIGISMTQLAAAWVMRQHSVGSVLIGASRPDQLDEPLAAVDLTLDDDVVDQLDKVTARFRSVGAHSRSGSDEAS